MLLLLLILDHPIPIPAKYAISSQLWSTEKLVFLSCFLLVNVVGKLSTFRFLRITLSMAELRRMNLRWQPKTIQLDNVPSCVRLSVCIHESLCDIFKCANTRWVTAIPTTQDNRKSAKSRLFRPHCAPGQWSLQKIFHKVHLYFDTARTELGPDKLNDKISRLEGWTNR